MIIVISQNQTRTAGSQRRMENSVLYLPELRIRFTPFISDYNLRPYDASILTGDRYWPNISKCY
jgi:hypothetical protein